MANGIKINVTHIYEGFSDYWCGTGYRCDDDKGCLFAYYGPDTTYADLIDGWIEDFNSGGDFDGKPLAEKVEERDLREALEAIVSVPLDTPYGPAQDLEDLDPENAESPISIVLVSLEKSDD